MVITSFPVLALTIFGVLAASILLVSYYIFVIKCCLNWNQRDMTSRAQIRIRGIDSLSLSIYPTNPIEPQGLDESTINSIPKFTYRKGNSESNEIDCAVCLNEFEEEETVRFLPNCLHVFHVDCIDTWLRTNANCPLCRSPIKTTDVHPENTRDDVVINVAEEEEHETHNASPKNIVGKTNSRSSCGGNECIEMRKLDEQFGVRPIIRRSFSLDSSYERWVFREVEKVLEQNPHFRDIGVPETKRFERNASCST